MSQTAGPHLFAPMMTIFPLANTSAVVRGSLIRRMSAWNFFGLYSRLFAFIAVALRSSEHCRLAVATTFLQRATARRCKASNGAGACERRQAPFRSRHTGGEAAGRAPARAQETQCIGCREAGRY